MSTRDLMNNITPVVLIAAAAAVSDNTPLVSNIVDTAGYESLTALIGIGDIADANATFTVLVEHGAESDLSDAEAAADKYLIGTEALAGFQYDDDNKARKIGYAGPKRYVRFTITPVNNEGNAYISAMGVLGHPREAPTANPPS